MVGGTSIIKQEQFFQFSLNWTNMPSYSQLIIKTSNQFFCLPDYAVCSSPEDGRKFLQARKPFCHLKKQ